MKAISLLFVFLLSVNPLSAQEGEFQTYDNGLIYSPQAISKLQHIVDSLNLKYKSCVAYPSFKGIRQGRADFFSITGKQAERALKRLQSGSTFDRLLSEFPSASPEPNVLVTIGVRESDEGNRRFIYSMDLGKKGGNKIEADDEGVVFPEGDLTGKWIWEYHEKTSYSDERLDAFYLKKDCVSRPLPARYAAMVAYSDCLVDTTAQVFLKTAQERYFYSDSSAVKVMACLDYIRTVLKRPEYEARPFAVDTLALAVEIEGKKMSRKQRKKMERQLKAAMEESKESESEQMAFFNRLEDWERKKYGRIDSLMQYDPKFKPLYEEAVAEMMARRVGNGELEVLMVRYGRPEEALFLKRNRIVVGGCSMDQGPRVHAMNIAQLSAETTKWEVFLRSHLDIMNDNVSRVSDGSWAWEGRQTYIKELEVLDIDVPTLLLGVALRVEDPASNHYFGNISRLGRAISESKDKTVFEERMKTMMADADLDECNRVLMYYLYCNYVHALRGTKKDQTDVQIESARQLLPADIAMMLRTSAR
ncbi:MULTISPECIES: hypothetical protein [unclassified Flavobacterium]|uniref:hypothetical protein n=1 Tax=unclassified Flavobacterium TaxID=196869 RepID=UPI001F12BFB2|nr:MULTISPECIES: hypothetical protein [unclassified Flavobacterium]UMY65525.1 hypothetical protein MKO97_13595 [Flavobacterium sp. HJ-32-4]